MVSTYSSVGAVYLRGLVSKERTYIRLVYPLGMQPNPSSYKYISTSPSVFEEWHTNALFSTHLN